VIDDAHTPRNKGFGIGVLLDWVKRKENQEHFSPSPRFGERGPGELMHPPPFTASTLPPSAPALFPRREKGARG